MELRLPLSWSFQPSECRELLIEPARLSLHSSGRTWIHTATVTGSALHPEALADALEGLSARYALIIRGCDRSHRSLMRPSRWSSMPTGIEATLPLPYAPSRHLRELEGRALRKGRIQDFAPLQTCDIIQLRQTFAELRRESMYRNRPPLRYLFLNDPGNWETGSFYIRNGRVLAAVGWSRNGPGMLHLEVLLRSREAPVGTMEALILHSIRRAEESGMQSISLGEVPFLHFQEKQVRSQTVGHVMPRRYGPYYLMRPAFNSMGLFRFKEKFRPVWTPLYLLSNRRIGLLSLMDLFFQSHCHRLLGYCLTHPRKS